MHVEIIYSMMWSIKAKKYNNYQYYADNHLGKHSKRQYYWMRYKEQYLHTLQGPQVLGWAACECPLHCPGPSLLKATSRLSLQWQGRLEKGRVPWEEGVRVLLHMGQTGYVSTTH